MTEQIRKETGMSETVEANRAKQQAEWYARDMPIPSPTMDWKRPNEIKPEIGRQYVVITNGWEWRDVYIRTMTGYELLDRMRLEIVRGRPEWIAMITNPIGAP